MIVLNAHPDTTRRNKTGKNATPARAVILRMICPLLTIRSDLIAANPVRGDVTELEKLRTTRQMDATTAQLVGLQKMNIAEARMNAMGALLDVGAMARD